MLVYLGFWAIKIECCPQDYVGGVGSGIASRSRTNAALLRGATHMKRHEINTSIRSSTDKRQRETKRGGP